MPAVVVLGPIEEQTMFRDVAIISNLILTCEWMSI